MVFNSLIVVSVAHLSAEAWQHVACLPERLSSRQLLDLVCVIPLQELGRLTLCLWTFLCVPPPDSYFSRYSDSDSDSDSDSSTTVDYDDYYYHPHSD
ncbi:hypothetical protein RchiOBHm_Chr5g0083831 [Rosa chinensis]|uniref:Uncharacterized protein n=1 Tax=Rosa chinensis TaxID=74649 RepID=A0A2P6QNN8_ROSCH|nr:uncharacterized protein LOC112202140 [Rosa chinensis]PRQ35794.1 hypothetical protein RchiOBHm_Chr5g0083831 [Rosa chinensis]